LNIYDQVASTFKELGLGIVHTRLYIVLARSGVSTARSIAKNAKVAPQDVYRLLNELADLGLVEIVIDKPTKYNALPLSEGLNLLLKRRKDNIVSIEKTITQLLEITEPLSASPDQKIGEFVLIPEKEPIDKMVSKIFSTATKSVDMMNNYQEVLIGHEKHSELKRKALNTGVVIREIVCSQKTSLPKEFTVFQKKYPHLVMKKIETPAPAILMIKDDSELFFATSTKFETLSQPFLWSNNPVLLCVFRQWYDNLWASSLDM
jgi:sugar-specific transcriptional regulator TrmB